MNHRKLSALGIPEGEIMRLAIRLVAQAGQKGLHKREIKRTLTALAADPSAVSDGNHFAPLARRLAELNAAKQRRADTLSPATWRQWGEDIDRQALMQMDNACRLPVARRGALMPDAHPGYGLPIGGVLAVEEAVIPYAVGTDIACRMCLTVLDLPPADLETRREELGRILDRETLFGGGAGFDRPHDHAVMSDAAWSETRLLTKLKGKARKQLGSSGGGNHFVEFGVLTLGAPDLDLPAGDFAAVLSHSGSRGPGGQVAQHYSEVARGLHPELPPQLQYLSWLSLDSEPGREYWRAMELMGRFAQANHALIHDKLRRALKAKVLARVENHHNFAWRERHDGRDLVVHRKGAIPAGEGRLGIIPGSMADPGYVVRGRGCDAALRSASHGAGRRFSRKEAKSRLVWGEVKKLLKQRGVTLVSGSLDETPEAYKNIQDVMGAQTELVDVVGRFRPRIVKMSD